MSSTWFVMNGISLSPPAHSYEEAVCRTKHGVPDPRATLFSKAINEAIGPLVMRKINPDKHEALRVELKALNAKYAALKELFDALNAAYSDAEKTIQRLIAENEDLQEDFAAEQQRI